MKRLMLVLSMVIFMIVGCYGISCTTEQKRAELIRELKEELRDTPTWELEKHLALYIQLENLDPANLTYRKKVGYYLHKAEEADQQLFENYKWGSSPSEVKKIATSKGHDVNNLKDASGYISRLLDEEVHVIFHFSPITKELYSVVLRWESTNIRKPLLKILTKKYGPPVRENVPTKKEKGYYWLPSVVLKLYKSKTKLYYVSTKFKEQQEVIAIENIERG